MTVGIFVGSTVGVDTLVGLGVSVRVTVGNMVVGIGVTLTQLGFFHSQRLVLFAHPP